MIELLLKYYEIFWVALRLGLTSFGGPVAHLGFFHEEYVKKKKWISDSNYADLVAICQFLPGPASSQVGMAIGLSRAGIWGAFFAWLGFTLPTAILLIGFGLSISKIDLSLHYQWLHGLKVVAVAVVAQAVYGMGRNLCPDRERKTIALCACVAILIFPSLAIVQIVILCIAAIYGALFLNTSEQLAHEPLQFKEKKYFSALTSLIIFITLLLGLPILSVFFDSNGIKMFDGFFRAGLLVFGGGHVVLALLQSEVVPAGWVSNDLFMSGYGMANAMPGPLFAFSGYLGAVSSVSPNGLQGAIVCLVAAFLPSFLLIVGVMPFWEKLRGISRVRQSMLGLNAAVVGILLAALYHPVWINGILSSRDFALASVGFVLLEYWKIPSWLIVLLNIGFCFIFVN